MKIRVQLQAHLGFHIKWISIIMSPLQTLIPFTYKISAKSSNPRLSYSNLKIWNLVHTIQPPPWISW